MKKMIERCKRWLAPSNNPNANAKSAQVKTVVILIGVAVFGIGFYLWSTAPNKRHHHVKPHFAGAFDDNVGTEYDHERIVALLDGMDKNHNALGKLQAQVAKQKKHAEVVATTRTEKQLEKMQQALSTLTERLNGLAEGQHTESAPTDKTTKKGAGSAEKKGSGKPVSKPLPPPPPVLNSVGIDDTQIVYQEAQSAPKRTAANYVWAGSFVNGYLLTGIIGDAGTNSTKNKGTVAIRLTTGGVMPNGQHSHLKGCVALGSTYGDLSSDSDVIRLETLSCAGKRYSFEKKVYGSVFDLDAMQDLRGIPVLKAKPILGYAAAAGLIAGIGDGLSSSGTTSTVTGSGIVQTPTSVLKSGLGQGISKPADKITDYLMSIANMYHPIVVAHAGRKVTVLFQAGFWIDKPHQKFQSMQSVDGGQQRSATTAARANQQLQAGRALLDRNRLHEQVAEASGEVVTMAQQKAERDFNQHKLTLGQGMFSPVANQEPK